MDNHMIRQFAITCKNKLESAHKRADRNIPMQALFDFADKDDKDFALYCWTEQASDITAGKCGDCGTSNAQKPYDNYNRFVVTYVGEKRRDYRVKIYRTLCGGCENIRTHASLPDSNIVYVAQPVFCAWNNQGLLQEGLQ